MQINIAVVAKSALANVRSLLDTWLPGGRYEGTEYRVCNPMRDDRTPGSFSINWHTGVWSDFASGDRGGDLVDLYQYLNNISNPADAAREIAAALGSLPPDPVPSKPQAPSASDYVGIVSPIPDNAPSPPAECPRKIDGKWHRFPVTHLWAYRSAAGKRLFYVVRINGPNGKETPPLALWKTADGRLKWRFKGLPPDSRPLYHLPELVASPPTVAVVVCEGEKCAEVAQEIFRAAGAPHIVVTWPGGTNSAKRADWAPLRGRTCVLWPDNDDPGRKVMRQIAGILRGLDCTIRGIQPPADKPEKWDVADAVLEDGWTAGDLARFVREHSKEIKSRAGKQQAVKKSAAPVPDGPPVVKYPFQCLGFNGDQCYYLPNGTHQVKAIRADMHGSGSLLSLAPLMWWERNFPGNTGPAWKYAADSLLRASERAGVYDLSRQRGRGGWYDAGRVVLHLGDRLVVDGRETRLTDLKSRYVYEWLPAMEYAHADPLSTQEAHRLQDILDSLFWEQPIYSKYVAGWCVCACICGALETRPHVWMTAAPGAGKTWIESHIIKPLLAEFCLHVQSTTTEAGIRQALGTDALAVMIDEFEGRDTNSRMRVQSIIELARQAFSDSGGRIVKGTAGGRSVSFQIRSMFFMSGVGVNITSHADETRIAVVTLGLPRATAERTADQHFKHLQKTVDDCLTPQWCAGFRARAISLIPVIRQNSKIFAQAIAETTTQRTGDQVGPLVAGAYSLTSKDVISLDAAREWVKKQNWSMQEEIAEKSDGIECLQHILSQCVSIERAGGGGIFQRTISELVVSALQRGREFNFDDGSMVEPIPPPDAAEEHLRRIGIGTDEKERILFISDNKILLRRVLRDTPWVNDFARQLMRLAGATHAYKIRFAGARTAATAVPIDVCVNVAGLDIE